MAFKARSEAKKYVPRDDDSLEAIAARETAEGNELTPDDISRFNWGTDDEDVVHEFLRDQHGCYKRGEDKGFVFSADVDAEEDLLLPQPFEWSGLATDREHTLRIRRPQPPPQQFYACCKVEGITFEFDKSFVRPSVVGDLEVLQQKMAEHPTAQVMIFGHTDKVGNKSYNKDLSERRAKSVYAFITDDTGIWEDLQAQEGWGTRENQEILKDLDGTMSPANSYDPGPIDGVNGPSTQQAVKNFQGDHGLTVDGVVGPNTRQQLYEKYMTGQRDIEIDASRFMEPKHMGCAEYNPLERNVDSRGPDGREPDSADQGERMEVNRRVTFYLFNPDRLPHIPCKFGDLAPCEKRVTPPGRLHISTFSCSFYDSLAHHCNCENGGTTPVVTERLLELVPAEASDEQFGFDAAAPKEDKRFMVSHHFAPKVEELEILYNISGHAGHKVELEIRSERVGADPIFKRELTAAEKANGNNKKLTWDGRTTIASGDLKGKFANPLFAPYKAKLVAATGDVTAEAKFFVLYHSIAVDFGKHTPDGLSPDEASDTNRWAQFQLNEKGFNAGPVNGTIDAVTQGALRRFQRSHYVAGTQTILTENGTLDANTRAALAVSAPRAQFDSANDPWTRDVRFWVHDNYYNDRGADLVTTNTPEFNSTNRKLHAEDKMERAFLPLEAEIKLLGKSNNAVSSPEAVGKVVVAWEGDDGTEDASAIPAASNATARTYVQRARQFGTTANVTGAARIDQNGDNCPKARQGFRETTAAANVKAWYPDDAGSKLEPYAVKGYGKETRGGSEFHHAQVEAWDHDTDHPARRGRAGLYLRMSTKGGDDLKVRAALSFEGQPNKDDLDNFHETWRAQLVKEGGRWTVYRWSTMAAYCQQAAPTRASGSPNWATINAWWSEAFYDFENNGSPRQVLNYGTVVPEATYKAAILAMPAARRPAGVVNAASLTYRASSMYGGPAIAQAPGEAAMAYVNRARNAMRAWVTNPINAILGVIHAHVRKTIPEGLIVFDFRIHDPVTGQDWNAATNSFTPTANPAARNVTSATAGYVRAAGAVTMCVDNVFNVNCYVLHECGHARFLYHHKTGGGGAGDASQNASHHDADQERCAMSYAIGGDAPNAWTYPFCGKCLLRLRGWEVTGLPNQYTT